MADRCRCGRLLRLARRSAKYRKPELCYACKRDEQVVNPRGGMPRPVPPVRGGRQGCTPPDLERRLALYEERAALGLPLFGEG